MNVVASSTPAGPASCLRGAPPTGGSTVSHPSLAGRSSAPAPATRFQSSGRPCGAGRSHGSARRLPAPFPSAAGGTSPGAGAGRAEALDAGLESGPREDDEPREEPGADPRGEPDGGTGGGVEEEGAE
jgi:hypothetical protein